MWFWTFSVVYLLSAAASAQDPWYIRFNGSAGPDGPWNVIQQVIDYPEETISVFPGLTEYNFWVRKQACPATNRCPLPIGGLWDQFGGSAQNLRNDLDSSDIPPKTVNSGWADILNLTGGGVLASARVVLVPTEVQNSSDKVYLDAVSTYMGNNISSAFPGGDAFSYTPDVGLLDLSAPGGANVNGTKWTAKDGNTTVFANSTLFNAFYTDNIPSISFGLHIGSALDNASIPGSLVLGGYDSGRILADPIVSSFADDAFTARLVDVALGTVNGTSPFANSTGSIEGLLQSSAGSPAGPTAVTPDPGVPYLYLPGATCDAIARNLPVSYAPDLNLYVWNSSDPSYAPLVASTTFLSFIFNSGTSTGNVTINVPLALLDLTLQYPVANVSTPYFPCRPYDQPEDYPPVLGNPDSAASVSTDSRSDGSRWAGYRLGRAFLQAAFLGINWQSNTLWLAQAPGPALPVETPNLVAIDTDDTTIQPLERAPQWADTWAGTLKAFDGQQYTPRDVGRVTLTPTAVGQPGTGKSLSGGAIAGIVIAVIVAVLIAVGAALFFLRRRRKQRAAAAAQAGLPSYSSEKGNQDGYYAGHTTDYKHAPTNAQDEGTPLETTQLELDGQGVSAELPDQSQHVYELLADTGERELHSGHDQSAESNSPMPTRQTTETAADAGQGQRLLHNHSPST